MLPPFVRPPHLKLQLNEQFALKLQGFVRQVQFSGRVQRRIKAKQEKAAAGVQYYWKNRLNLGAGANMFAELIAQRKRE